MRKTSKLFQRTFFFQVVFFVSIFVFTSAALTFFSGVSVNADVYKYKDKNGDVVFTDDLSSVPESQRESALMIRDREKESKTEKVIEPAGDEKNADKDSGSNSVSEREEIRDELVNRKAELKEKSRSLKAERKKLEKRKQSIQSREERDAFKKKLKDYNRRIKEHNAEEKRLHEKIKQFNQSLPD